MILSLFICSCSYDEEIDAATQAAAESCKETCNEMFEELINDLSNIANNICLSKEDMIEILSTIEERNTIDNESSNRANE